MPAWVEKWICGHLAIFLRMEPPGKEKDNEEDEEDKKMNNINDMTAKSLLANVLDINDDYGITNKPRKAATKKYDQIILKRETSCDNCNDNIKMDPSCKKLINNILKELQVLTKKIQDDAEDEEKELNWKFAAMVVDRLCMWFFAIATFASTVGILFTAKNFFKFK